MKKDIPVLLVDSKCAVCNRAVRFIRKYQKRDVTIMFRSLFTDEGRQYLRSYGFSEDYDRSLILIEKGVAYTRSDAVLRVAGKMKGLFPLLAAFRIIPRKVRDYFYDVIARHRHRIT